MNLRYILCALLCAVALRAADALPVFNATLTMGKESRFVLVNGAGKTSTFLGLGETFDGYKLKSYDAKSGVLEVERDGKVSRLTLVADAAVKNAPPVTRATIEDATAVLNAMNFEQMMDKTMEGAKRQQIAMVDKMMGQMTGPGTDREAVAEFQKKVMNEMMSAISGADIKNDMARVYSDVFTKEELQQLGAFYASPLGQTFSDKQPVLAEKMNEVIMPRMMAAVPKVQQMAKEFGMQQKAKREAAAGAAGTPGTPPPSSTAPKQ